MSRRPPWSPRTMVPPGFFDSLLRELDEPPVRNQRTSDAAKRARDSIYRNVDQQAAYLRDMVLVEYLSAVRTTRLAHPECRLGQAHYNTLRVLHPDIADEVHARPELDPFFVDDRLPAFLDFVRARLAARRCCGGPA